jgi:hypothetical protein
MSQGLGTADLALAHPVKRSLAEAGLEIVQAGMQECDFRCQDRDR